MTLGIIGGSGFYSMFDSSVDQVEIETPFGSPSNNFLVGSYNENKIVFLPRHGENHTLAPHQINYLANIYAMKKLGVTKLIGVNAAGSLKKEIKPGSLVVVDQFINRTEGRKDTYCGSDIYNGIIHHHFGFEFYCKNLRQSLIDCIKDNNNLECHESGTVVVINGPRFSSKAESKWYINQGWDIINMTQYPEVILARELGICYANVSLISDYDCGLEESLENHDIEKTLKANKESIQKIFPKIVDSINFKKCDCCNDVLKV